MNENIINHTQRVNKTIAAIEFLGILMLVFLAVTDEAFNFSIFKAFYCIGVIISIVALYKKAFTKTTSGLLMLSLVFLILNDTVRSSSDYNAGYAAMMLAIAVSLSTLYLNKVILLINGAIYNVIFIAFQLRFDKLDIPTIVLFEFIILILFFVCKWGNELIQLAAQKENQATELLHSLDNALNVVSENTITLNKDIAKCNENVGILKGSSSTMTTTVHEVTKGVVSQGESISQISDMMSNADNKVLEINSFSKHLAATSLNASQIVSEGTESVNHMEKQIDIINDAVTDSLSTVQELDKSMDNINHFLSGINQIASQTNLLALNAAIEAAKEGEVITEKVNEGFEKIKISFRSIDEYITKEFKMIENVGSIFTQIREQAECIASISEEHSAATEEILATTEEQNVRIENIYELINGINNSSTRLQEIIHEN